MKKKTLAQLMQERGAEAILKLLREGKVSARESYDSRTIDAFLDDISQNVVGDSSVAPSDLYRSLPSRIQLIKIHDPDRNVTYLTLAANGKAVRSGQHPARLP